MKLNRLKIVAVCIAVMSLASCKEEYLEVDSNGLITEDSFYKNEEQAFGALTAVYDVLGWDTFVNRTVGLNAASDDFYTGGGGSGDVGEIQVWSTYTLTPTFGPQAEYWRKAYSGVFRANVLLHKLPEATMGEATKNRFIAETKSLRAYFYFDLVRFFKNIPLITEPVPVDQWYNVEQVAPEMVFAQIESDLLDAIPNLPVTVDGATEGGRFTQGAAKALLGRVYLWEKKYTQAATQLADVNGTPGGSNMYGYQLLADFADLWDYSNKFNAESILEIVHTNSGNWGDWGNIAGSEGNLMVQMVGPRSYTALTEDAPDYTSGYSFNPVTVDLYNAFTATDLRRDASIANLNQLSDDGVASYAPGYLDTGFFLKKFMGRDSFKHTGGGVDVLNWDKDSYDIRLADTYLMEAEALIMGGGSATRAQALLDAVRERAGLASVPATEENIIKERRLELAGEGHRWFDLVRTGMAPTVLGSEGFVAGKHEILPIPLDELSNTLLVQNPMY